MSNKILVTYASRAGSTKDTAEVVAAILAENGIAVDVLPMEAVDDLVLYRAVVAGSAIQNRQWLPEAVQFIQRHQAALNQKTFAIFSLCMTLAMKNGERFRADIREWIAPVRRQVQPISEGLFAGALDIAKIPAFGDRLKFRMSVLFGVWSEGDHRDMEAIRTWATGLIPKLSG